MRKKRTTEGGDIFDGIELPPVTAYDLGRKKALPPIPETGWKTPTEFPRLKDAKWIALDTEAYDPELLEHGPGWARGKGHLVGISAAVATGEKWYFPMRHEVEAHDNLDPTHVLAWARDNLCEKSQTIVGANLTYDIGWLQQEGVRVKGNLFDVQFAEALLSEDGAVNLDWLGMKYLNKHKETSKLYQWSQQAYGGVIGPKQRANIYRCPPSLVGHYAETDATLPLELVQPLTTKLVEEGLYHIFDLECSLPYFLIAMRFAGVSVDLSKTDEVRNSVIREIQLASDKLDVQAGFEVNVNASASLARLFTKLGISFKKTEKGNPTFDKAFLENVEHPIAEDILHIRGLKTLLGTFLEGHILGSHVNGRVYGQFNQLRGDAGGTRSGRFSADKPNLQNVPSRGALAKTVRGLFIPDCGHIQWRKYDYSQIEYRFLIHYAVGAGADEARAHFQAHPDTDYHERALDLVAPEAGWDISTPDLRKERRKPLKTINFGLIYGMGTGKLGRSLGLDSRAAKQLFAAYHRGVPFAKATMDATSLEASTQGYITTYLGRRSRFDMWEPDDGQKGVPLPYQQAIRQYGRVRRAYLHKALNRRLQGSAADMLKVACARLWQEGVFDYIGVPRLTVHDELDFSDKGGVDDGFAYMQYVLENAIPLRVPIKADGEIGPDWGHVK